MRSPLDYTPEKPFYPKNPRISPTGPPTRTRFITPSCIENQQKMVNLKQPSNLAGMYFLLGKKDLGKCACNSLRLAIMTTPDVIILESVKKIKAQLKW